MFGPFQNMLMKQLQKVQEQLVKIQSELAEERLEGSAGGGVVKVSINGIGEIQSVKIDPQVVTADDVELLEDLLTAAVREAVGCAQERRAERMRELTGGLNIPGLF